MLSKEVVFTTVLHGVIFVLFCFLLKRPDLEQASLCVDLVFLELTL